MRFLAVAEGFRCAKTKKKLCCIRSLLQQFPSEYRQIWSRISHWRVEDRRWSFNTLLRMQRAMEGSANSRPEPYRRRPLPSPHAADVAASRSIFRPTENSANPISLLCCRSFPYVDAAIRLQKGAFVHVLIIPERVQIHGVSTGGG